MIRTLKFNLIFIIITLSAYNSFSQSSIAQAQSIFTYNFTRLIEWSADYKSGDFIIGVYGNADFYSEIKSYTTGKSVGNQTIIIKKFNSAQEIGKCHILFVSSGRSKDIPLLVDKIGSGKTLIIAEKKGSLEEGAAINFTIIDDKLKYEIKTSNITKMGLKYNSNIENMAIAKH